MVGGVKMARLAVDSLDLSHGAHATSSNVISSDMTSQSSMRKCEWVLSSIPVNTECLIVTFPC